MISKNIQKAKYPFEDYLQDIHAKQYTGLDDGMPDDYNDWIAAQDPNDLIEHANVFSRFLIDLI